jgi:CRISP-associated protein Cas1
MQLYLDSFGASLRVKNKMFWVKPLHSEGRTFPIREVNAIFMTKGVHVSTGALFLAIEHQIPVLLINGIGHLVGQVWSGQYGSIASIRKQQALLSQHPKGMLWIKDLMIQKLESQKTLIQRWANHKTLNPVMDYEKLDGSIRVIHNMIVKYKTFDLKDFKDLKDIEMTFRGWEGTASRHYFICLSQLLPQKYQFNGRSKRPAYDNFNALLNYLYGILYAQVHLALIKAGLDPFMSIFHADQHNKPTFVYDVIEIYRHWMEEVALRLCCFQQLGEDAFITPDDKTGIWINRPAKPIIVNTCLDFLNERVDYNGISRKRLTHIDLDAQRWATQFREMTF